MLVHSLRVRVFRALRQNSAFLEHSANSIPRLREGRILAGPDRCRLFISRLTLKIKPTLTTFIRVVATVKSIPNSIAGLKEWRLIGGLTKKAINIDVISSESIDQDNEDIRQLRIKLPALQL